MFFYNDNLGCYAMYYNCFYPTPTEKDPNFMTHCFCMATSSDAVNWKPYDNNLKFDKKYFANQILPADDYLEVATILKDNDGIYHFYGVYVDWKSLSLYTVPFASNDGVYIYEDTSIVGGNLIEFCNRLPIPCGIAHTDMFLYCDKYGYDYKEFFKKMAENNIFWEMNVSYDQVHHYREHQYVKDLFSDKEKLKLVLDSNVCLSIGFDSHRHQDYDGHRVTEWYVKLKNHGFKVVDDQVILNMKKQKTNK